MATIDQLSTALVNADKAGDVDAARTLASEIVRLRSLQSQSEENANLMSQMSQATRSADNNPEASQTAVDAIRAQKDREEFNTLPIWQKPLVAANDLVRLAANGMSFGFANKAAAALDAASGKGTYEQKLAEQRAFDDQSRNRAQGAGYVADYGGMLATPMALAGRGVTLAGRFGPSVLGRTAALGAEGVAYGGLSAAGNDQDIAKGMGIGLAFGLGTPIVGKVVSAVSKPVVDAISARMNPALFASKKVAERVGDSMPLEQAAQRMEMSPGSNLADVSGQSARDLLRTTVNVPGPAKDRVTKSLTIRQMGQGDRIKNVVQDVFADPDGFITASDKLAQQWSKVGNDVYEPALSKPVVYSDRLKQFLDEPIMQRGIAQGIKIQRLESLAEGKPFNPSDYAITGFNEAGDPILGKVPNMRTLNVAKKGLDAMIGDMKNPLTGKLTEEGRATDMVRRAFLNEVDSFNPDYKVARGVWGGFAKVKEALQFGQSDALNMSPEAVAKSFKDMSISEQQAARIGIADAMRKKIDAAGFTNNAILKIFSNRQNVGVLKAAFPNQEQFGEFRKAIFSEARKRKTYEAVRGNSTTASQLADMMETGGTRFGAEAQAAKTLATGGGIVNATLNYLGTKLKTLGGLTPEVADNIAKQLMTTNSGDVMRIAKQFRDIEQSRMTAAARRQAIQALLTNSAAVMSGPIIAGYGR